MSCLPVVFPRWHTSDVVEQWLLLECYRFRATGGAQGGGIRSTAASPTGKSSRRFVPRNLGQQPQLSMRAPSLSMPYRSNMSMGSFAHPPQGSGFHPPLQAMVGVGLGLSLHSTQPGMVVTEVAAWCQIHSGELQRIEVGDMLKAIDDWARHAGRRGSQTPPPGPTAYPGHIRRAPAKRRIQCNSRARQLRDVAHEHCAGSPLATQQLAVVSCKQGAGSTTNGMPCTASLSGQYPHLCCSNPMIFLALVFPPLRLCECAH